MVSISARATNYAPVWTAITLSNSTAAQVSAYTLDADNAAAGGSGCVNSCIAAGVSVVITFPAGTDATTAVLAGSTFDGTAIASFTAQTATSLSFAAPVSIAKGATFSVVIQGVTNPSAGTYNTLSMVAPNASGGTNTFSGGASYTVNAPQFNQMNKIVAADRFNSDFFGYAVSISGTYAIVGAYQEDEDVSGSNTLADAGAAYLYEYNGTNWVQVQKIVASDRAAGDNFGRSVSISGTYAIVGAYLEDEDAAGANTMADAGSAYIFERISGTWTQVKKIVASDRATLDWFGFSLGISGTYAIVGAYQEDQDAAGANTMSMAGSAYLYERISGTWTQVKKIVPSDRAASDQFGYTVSISGVYAMAGANYEDEDAAGANTMNSAGSAYVFERISGTWTQAQKIVASDRAAGDYFGASVNLSGTYAIVSAYLEDEDASGLNNMLNSGSAYVFERISGTWTQVNKLDASDRAAGDYFGISVSISGNYAIVGANNEDEDPAGLNTVSNCGSAYIFERDGAGAWSQKQKIVASDRGIGDSFGYSVSISGDYAIAGAYFEDEDASGLNTLGSAGSAYVFGIASAALPLDILSFTGINDGRINRLEWHTAAESSEAFFVVERSSDGYSFESLGQVKAAGNASLSAHYSFTDEHPAAGINYYRLRETVYDGRSSLSSVIALQSGDASVALISPNPFSHSAELVIQGYPLSREVKLLIYDMLGREAACMRFTDGRRVIGREMLKDGLYFYVVKAGDETIATGKIVIN